MSEHAPDGCDWLGAMAARHSVRAYRADPIPPRVLEQLQQALHNAVPLRGDVQVRISLLPYAAISSRIAVGAILPVRPAPYYLIMHAPAHPFRMEEVGFRGEQVILQATALGLGTCWTGAFRASDALAHAVGASKAEIVALSPVGWPARGIAARAAYAAVETFAARRGARKPLGEVAFAGTWGRPVEQKLLAPSLERALDLARLAPSWSNVQPWYFLVRASEVLVFADSRPQRGNSRPGKPYYRLDAGIAACHLYLALVAQGVNCICEGLADLEPATRQELQLPEHVVPIARVAFAAA